VCWSGRQQGGKLREIKSQREKEREREREMGGGVKAAAWLLNEVQTKERRSKVGAVQVQGGSS